MPEIFFTIFKVRLSNICICVFVGRRSSHLQSKRPERITLLYTPPVFDSMIPYFPAGILKGRKPIKNTAPAHKMSIMSDKIDFFHNAALLKFLSPDSI